MFRLRRPALALGCSLAVYLIPLVGPHAIWLLGESLFQVRERPPGWILANWAAALILQSLLFCMLLWVFARPGWRRTAVPVIVAPGIFVITQWVFMFAIPTHFLEESDTAPENLSWQQECGLPNYFQTGLSSSAELWVRSNSDPAGYAVLTMPACRVEASPLPKPVFLSPSRVESIADPVSVIPGGQAVVRKTTTGDGSLSFFRVAGVLTPLPAPPGYGKLEAAPMLSADGRWAVWIERIPGSGPPMNTRIFVQALAGNSPPALIDLTSLGAASYSLYGVDSGGQRILLWRNDGLIEIDRTGSLVREYPRPVRVRAQPQTYLSAGEHWLAWDAYRESGPYQVEWSLAGGSGWHRARLGRTIHSAAMDPEGKWIAISVGTSLNIGDARDSVYVLRASGGQEVFRKYLPRYCRSPVAFLSNGYLAYSDLDGVHVLKVPL